MGECSVHSAWHHRRSKNGTFVRDLASGLPTSLLTVTAVPRELTDLLLLHQRLAVQEDTGVPLVTSLAAWPSNTWLCGFSVSLGFGSHQPLGRLRVSNGLNFFLSAVGGQVC